MYESRRAACVRVQLQVLWGSTRRRIHQLGACGDLLDQRWCSLDVFVDMLVVRRLVGFEIPCTLYRICSGTYRRINFDTRAHTRHASRTYTACQHDELVGVVAVLPRGHYVISELRV